jgi:exosortase
MLNKTSKFWALVQPVKTASWRLVAFASGLLIVGAVFHSTLALWLRFSWTYEHYSHLVLIPFISAYLVYTERRTVFREVATAPASAAVVGLAALVLIAAAHFRRPVLNENDFLTITMTGLVTLIVAAFIGLWGRKSARAAAFSLGFLFLSVPLPLFVIDGFIEALRHGSAALVYFLFRLVEIPVLRHGYVFVLPHQSIEVARECSGIRSSMAMLVLVLLCGHWGLRSNMRRIILLLLTIPLLIFKNAVRIVTLTLLAEYVDPSFLSGSLHRDGGILFFAMTFCIVGLILHVLRRSESLSEPVVAASPL